MKITCISDLHGHLPELPGGDLLIVAGDLTARDQKFEYSIFSEWFLKQDYRKKIVIAGNHDGCIENGDYYFNHEWLGYLQDSGTELEGLKIWGSPWTPEFCDWHFMLPRGKPLREKWDLIPDDTDILVTHGPPYQVLDMVEDRYDMGLNQGCCDLLNAVEKVKPKLHIFGHIHEGYGQWTNEFGTRFINCSIMDRNYRPINKPITLEINVP